MGFVVAAVLLVPTMIEYVYADDPTYSHSEIDWSSIANNGRALSMFVDDSEYIWVGHRDTNYSCSDSNDLDCGDRPLVKLDISGNTIFEMSSIVGTTNCENRFGNAHDVTVTSSKIFILTGNGDCIVVYDSSGNFLNTSGNIFGSYQDKLNNPLSMDVDSSGYIWIADSRNHRVSQWNPDGLSFAGINIGGGDCLDSWEAYLGTCVNWPNSSAYPPISGTGDYEFISPKSLAIDSSDNIYILDDGQSPPRVSKFSNDGTFITKWNVSNNSKDIAVGPSGNIYVLNISGIQVFSASGVFDHEISSDGDWDFVGLQSCIFTCLDVDSSEKIYVIDSNLIHIFEETASSNVGPFTINYFEIFEESGHTRFKVGGDMPEPFVSRSMTYVITDSNGNVTYDYLTTTTVNGESYGVDAPVFYTSTSWNSAGQGTGGDYTQEYDGNFTLKICAPEIEQCMEKEFTISNDSAATGPFTITDDSTGGDCSSIGTWNSATKTCTLSNNLNGPIIIGSNDVTLDGNGKSITGTYTSLNPSASTFTEGVKIDGATGVTVKNLVINNVNSGIYLSSSENNSIYDNTLSNNGYGVNLYDSPSNTIRDNTITSDDGYGIKNDRSHLTIITGNTQSGASTGISVTNSNQLTIDGNTFTDHQQGIYLNNVGQITVTHNFFYSGAFDRQSLTQSAIQIDGGGWHTIAFNNISGWAEYGIKVSATAVSIHNNVINGAKNAIFLQDSMGDGQCSGFEKFWLSQNTINMQSYPEMSNGIIAYNSEKICYDDNQIIAGVDTYGDQRSLTLNGDKNSIVKNNYVYVGNYGLTVSNSEGTTITGNTANNFLYHGIFVSNSQLITIIDNIANDNGDQYHDYGGDGFYLSGSGVGTNTITTMIGNTANNNSHYGFNVDSFSEVTTFTGNTATGNGVSDIEGDAVSNVVITGEIIVSESSNNQCHLIGTWDPDSKTCTLGIDLQGNIVIYGDDITFNGGHHYIYNSEQASGSGPAGITVTGSNNHILYSLIESHTAGILITGDNAYVHNNNLKSNYVGFQISPNTLGAGNNTFTDNTIRDSFGNAFSISNSNDNKIYNNIFKDNTVKGTHVNGNNNILTLDAPYGGNYYDNEADMYSSGDCQENWIEGAFCSGGNGPMVF
ncbi:MAG: hypothetical protein HN875_03405, partial [Candidatus Nitrosopelagicus sp.]|nr:hypothetical protein [Candidatus Nitrosopelagicus sp.]